MSTKLELAQTNFINQNLSADTITGEFVGAKDLQNGVISFKGIPYAKAPVGELRWQPPQALAPSDEKYTALEFGDMALQNLNEKDLAHGLSTSEDALKLNIYTSDINTPNKPVMFYIHEGVYSWGGAPAPLHDGKFIVENNPDIIVVTTNYRLNTLGFADLKQVPGYDERYKDAQYLGLLDDIAALKWVKENIASFGGDPNNITIFGESAGGASVSALLASPITTGLFNRAIVQSGALNLTNSQASFDSLNQIGALMSVTGAQNMNDLLSLNEEQILQAWQSEVLNSRSDTLTPLKNLNAFPLRGDGSIIPQDPYAALQSGVNKDVDLLIGTTSDELRVVISGIDGIVDNTALSLAIFNEIAKNKVASLIPNIKEENQHYLNEYFDVLDVKDDVYSQMFPNIWKNAELINDLYFRMPTLKEALAHANAGGKTYMYNFGKVSQKSPWLGASHTSDLNYTFYNLDETTNYIADLDEFVGKIDENLAKKMVTMWANFARNGDPSLPDFTWVPFDATNQATMVVDANGNLSMQNHFKAAQNELLNKTGLKYDYMDTLSNDFAADMALLGMTDAESLPL